jgi:hypothetical protein
MPEEWRFTRIRSKSTEANSKLMQTAKTAVTLTVLLIVEREIYNYAYYQNLMTMSIVAVIPSC